MKASDLSISQYRQLRAVLECALATVGRDYEWWENNCDHKRDAEVIEVMYTAIYFAKTKYGFSNIKLATFFNREHCTITYGVAAFAKWLVTEGYGQRCRVECERRIRLMEARLLGRIEPEQAEALPRPSP